MDSDLNQIRFEKIYQMLLLMGKGNFTHRIKQSGEDDNLEIITVLVNMLAEELNGLISHKGYVNPHHSSKYLVQNSFILDSNFIIKSFNSDVFNNLGYTPEDLINTQFSSILTKESLQVWNHIKEDLRRNFIQASAQQLTYITKKQLHKPSFCNISRLFHNNDILISSVCNIVEETSLPAKLISSTDTIKPAGLYRLSDVQLIQSVYDYILNNLDKPLPTIKELSRMFGTNEYKLKYGFKYLFKTSIYKFYNNKRLQRAHLLIQQTTIPLKEIASKCGFSTYPNFSKAFKKLFGYSPNNVSRKYTDFTNP
ncbi:helix-turn-helix domain-containing protein [Lutibacter sp. A64]|uniref:helix-turn-helix domain-containing protein n=1 Tax=Lutibacter sp. A64 TaxID=2918526 RepID=UPI001F056918|nr:helix-turn-helix domain-containing protein [Lutibacter sp. A64]UMB54207.1 helix-turn-helix domain-containing protein [Lutibacter sp. A64]